MKIRRYLGKDTQEALLKVKMDLGNDAMILNTRKVRQKGFLKIFSKPLIEVLAAVDEYYGNKKESNGKEDREKTVAKSQNQDVREQPKAAEREEKISVLENKVNSMENLLQKVYEQLQAASQKESSQKQDDKVQPASNVISLFYNNLIKNEVDPEIVKKIVDQLNQKVGASASVNDTAAILYNIISGMLGKPDPLKLRQDGKPTVIIFIGPTGVGKTTTLAKIAANYALNHKKSVGLITADTYRIAAVEQLKTYAEILGMPVNVIYSAAEMSETIKQYSDKDIILIDTAGRSVRNKSQFEELKVLVNASEADEIYLVLSATTSIRNCKDIISNYNFIDNFKLIFTKLDETPITGIILNSKFYTNKSLSYVTNGQSVPDDIEIANVDKITKNLLGSIS